jgi:hypothetical protein
MKPRCNASTLLNRLALVLGLALASCNGSPGVPLSLNHAALSGAPAPAKGNSGSSSCLTMTCIYDYSYSFRNHRVQITSYASNATGDVAPIGRIAGKRTKLQEGFDAYYGIAVGPDHKIYAYNCSGPSCTPTIEIYAAGANGNVSPIATISGTYTGLLPMDGYVTVDGNGTIYAASCDYEEHGVVTVYAPGSTGNAVPIQVISGSYTGLGQPLGIAVDSADNIYVTNGHSSITVYAAGSTGNVAPIQQISGSNTRLSGVRPYGMALDSAGNMYVSNSHAVLVFAAGATGNVAPTRSIFGKKSKLTGPTAVALDGGDNLYVANTNALVTGASWVTVYRPGADGDHRPAQLIKGGDTLLDSHQSTGIAVR